MKKYLCLLLALLLLTTAFSACGDDSNPAAPLYAERGEIRRAALGELIPAADPETVLTALRAAGTAQTDRWQPEDGKAAETGPGLCLSSPTGDTLVTDGANLYMLDSYGLVAVSAAGASSSLRSYTKVSFGGEHWGERLCLWQDRIAVLWNAVDDDGEDLQRDPETRIALFSVADPAAPTQLATLALEGSLVDACLLEGNLCVVTQKTLLALPESEQAERVLPKLRENDKSFTLRAGEIYLCPDPAKAALTVAAVVRLEDGRFLDALAFTDGTEALRVDGKDLYLARTRWTEKASEPRREGGYSVVDYESAAETEIKRLRFDRSLSLEDGCRLYGALTDPEAFSVENGQLRVATEVDERSYSVYTDESHGWSNCEGRSHVTDSQLALLDGSLNVVGALAKLGGEQGITACRFLNANAWIAAGDSLSAADLSDPAQPQVRGSFSVTGETLLLRDLGKGRVLTLALPLPGQELRLTAYDVSDPAKPGELGSAASDAVPVGDLSARGALLADAASGFIGWTAAGEKGAEYRLLQWTGEKFQDKGALPLDYVPDNARGLMLNGLLYICSPGQVCVLDPASMKLLTTVSNAVG